MTLFSFFALATNTVRTSVALGELDATFGIGGVVSFENSPASAVGVQSNGRVIVVQGTVVTGYRPDGSVDPSFGQNGSTHPSLYHGHFFSVAIQPDNKIIAAGFGVINAPPYYNDFALVRFNTDGSLDTTFGNGGKVITRIGSGNDYAYSVAIQPDSKIVAAGRSGGAFAIARYNTDGSLDTGFGLGGKAVSDPTSGYDQFNSVAIQPDGRILAVGSTYYPEQTYLVRYTSLGAPDLDFGNEGTVVGAPGSSVAVQRDGKIVAGGSISQNGGEDFILSRYLSDGSPDETFGQGGRVTTDFGGGSDRVIGIIVQPDDSILASGTAGPQENPAFALSKYGPNGDLDNRFGSGGKVVTDLSPEFDIVKGIAIQRDGRILLAGFTDWDGTYYDDYMDLAVVRYQNEVGQTRITVTGRVMSPTGSPLRGISVSLIDTAGNRRTVTTSSFGIYSFDNVPVGTECIITAASKRFRFAARTITASEFAANNIDLIGFD